MDSAEPPRCRGGARRMSLPEGQRIVITGLSLMIDPASAAVALPPLQVHVWAQAGQGARAIAIGKLSLENPIAPVRPPVQLGGDGEEFLLCHDSAWYTVRLYGYYLYQSNPEGEREPRTGMRTRFVEDMHAEEVPDGEEDMYAEQVHDDEEDMHAEQVPGEEYDDAYAEEMLEEEKERVEYEPLTEEDMAERYDSDNGEDDDDPRKVCDTEVAAESSKARNSTALVDAPAGVVVPDGDFLGPPRFAAVKNTAGFMRIAAGTGSQDVEGNKNEEEEILVLYRYTRFSRTWSGRRGVEACRRTKLHWLRFAVRPAADMESALAWAGLSLGPLIYPRLFRRELRDLWSSLLAAPAIDTNTIPLFQAWRHLEATRLQVVVDVGILRREDYTAERMEHVRGALEAAAGEAWPEYYHVGMELRLPEPVTRREVGGDEDDDDAARPAKRRRVVVEEGEECSVCLDPMESGLTAWPGCPHVFHGQCVEQTLAEKATCPLCRHDLCSDTVVC